MNPADSFSSNSSNDAVNEAAALWLARRESGFTALQAAEFSRWRDAEPRHATELERAQATQHLLARLPETAEVAAMLAEVDGLCALQAKAKGLTLNVAQCERDVLVAADAERFQQILLNLITNATKFTASGGRIDVTCDVQAESLRIRVRDTGVGVRPIDIERVFEPFVQIDRHLTSSTQQGVGLGLSISRELARAMQGDLTLESAEGIGSTFTLTLPLASQKSGVTPPAPSGSVNGDSPYPRALAS